MHEVSNFPRHVARDRGGRVCNSDILATGYLNDFCIADCLKGHTPLLYYFVELLCRVPPLMGSRAATIASKGLSPLLSPAASRAATYGLAGRHYCFEGPHSITFSSCVVGRHLWVRGPHAARGPPLLHHCPN